MRTPEGFIIKSSYISKNFRQPNNLFLTPNKVIEAFELLWVCDESVIQEILDDCDIPLVEIEDIGRISEPEPV